MKRAGTRNVFSFTWPNALTIDDCYSHYSRLFVIRYSGFPDTRMFYTLRCSSFITISLPSFNAGEWSAPQIGHSPLQKREGTGASFLY